MSYDYSLMDAMGNYTGGSVDPFATPDNSTTATTQVAQTAPAFAPQPARVNGIPSKYRTGPVSADYNANIAQQESGGRADIGFHNKEKSSAYGPYGMTTAAYQDARKVNPTLPEDITQATPEQLTAGQDAYTQQNAKYLTNYGIEPTANTLGAAHFLGAKGLSDYMKTGYISPQAAAANGGEENVRKIVNARLGGQAAPASGAAQPAAPQTQTAINPETGETYQQLVPTAEAAPAPISPEQAAPAPAPAEQPYTGAGLTISGKTQADLERDRQHTSILNSNSQEILSKLAFDPNTPRDVASAAFDKLHGTMAVQTGMDRAKQKMAELGTSPNPQALTKAMNDKETGSYLKVLLFQALGWTGKAQQELDKIMPSVTYSGVTLPTGENYNVKYNKTTGEAIAAWDSQGQPVTDKATLGAIAAGGVNPATAKSYLMPQTSGSPVTKTIDGKIVNGIQIYDPVRKSFYVQYGNQRDNSPEGWTSAAQNVEQQALLGKQKAQIDLMKKFEGANIDAKFKYIEDTNKELVSKFGPNAPLITPADVGLKAIQAPGAQPAGAVAPVGGVQAAPVVPGTPAATGVVPAPGKVPTLSAMQEEAAKKKQALEVSTDEMKKFNEYAEKDITPKADAGSQVSRIRKEQIKGPDGILANPELAGILQGQGGAATEVLNILRDTITGNFKDGDELSRRVNALNLTQRQKDVVNVQVGLAKQVDPFTLKQNAGPGAVSDAEQKANRQANVDITRSPLYTGLTLMTRSQFTNDLSVARAEFKAARPDLNSTEKFNSAWNTEKARLNKEYDAIYEERAKYIAQYNKDGKNPGAIIDAYKYYPVPEYNSENKSWVYGGYSDKAKRPKLGSFVK